MTVRAEPKSAGSSRVVLIAGVAALGGFLFGFDSSVINGGVNAIRDEFDIGSALIGFVVSIALLGSAVGAWFAGPLADRYGRIRVMLVAAAVFLVSAIGAGLPFAVWDLMFWRLVGGFAIGAASVIAPTYIAEVARPGYGAALARCNSSRSSSASSSRCSRTTRWQRQPAARHPTSCGGVWRLGSGCSWSASSPRRPTACWH